MCQCNHKVLTREKQELTVGKGDVKMEPEVRMMHFEDGGRSHGPRNAGGH